MIEFIVVGAVIVVLAVWVVATYNRLVGRRNRVEEAWSGIDVQLQRRADLVPNLVETVRGYAGHERETFEQVTLARSGLTAATGPEAAGIADEKLSGALKQLFAVAEAYPDLKASTHFLALQADLVAIEEELSFARKFHNAVVQDLNTSIQRIPTVFVARPLGFEEREYFQAGIGDRTVPTVDLDR